MWTLHSVTEKVKKFSIEFVVIIVLIIFASFIFSTISKLLTKPPQPIGPALAFGQLPPIAFPSPSVPTKLAYTLATIDGKADIIDSTTHQPAAIADQMNVYKMLTSQANLTSLQTAKTKVTALGFPLSSTIKRLSDTEYSWTTTTGLPETVDIDITNFNFHLDSPYLTYPSIVAGTNAPTDESAVTLVDTLLSSMQLVPSDTTSPPTTTDYTIQNNALRLAYPGEPVHAVRVNYIQKPIDTIPIVYPGDINSNMNFLVTGGDTQAQVSQAIFVHQTPDTSPSGSSTYPTRSSTDAYADLLAGKGYVTPTFSGTNNQVRIQNISLAYYIGDTVQPYLTPVYVFHGDNNFVAYVSAINDNPIQPTTH